MFRGGIQFVDEEYMIFSRTRAIPEISQELEIGGNKRI
jgi:hypothetical protein